MTIDKMKQIKQYSTKCLSYTKVSCRDLLLFLRSCWNKISKKKPEIFEISHQKSRNFLFISHCIDDISLFCVKLKKLSNHFVWVNLILNFKLFCFNQKCEIKNFLKNQFFNPLFICDASSDFKFALLTRKILYEMITSPCYK